MELEFLVGRPIGTVAEARAAAQEIRAMGPETVIVTSLEERAGFPDTIPVVAVDGNGAWQAEVTRLDVPVDGAGDLFAAVFTAAALKGKTTADALSHALSSTHGVLRRTVELGVPEMALVDAQGEIAAPSSIPRVGPDEPTKLPGIYLDSGIQEAGTKPPSQEEQTVSAPASARDDASKLAAEGGRTPPQDAGGRSGGSAPPVPNE
jgi:hypothetical protein